ncbi:hypothetical protein K3722_11420 [Leisingera caerulea]|uniref:Uncharacterized protein n=1 Tax=Leisingera caerulea TaxID=506591 RepID=A0ABY5WS54_LEICA|nr:hypothetical protein [Leisingera caerulea]UWQ57142.1 hypothetical protein K3722_11420 [Leisingera caerulea]
MIQDEAAFPVLHMIDRMDHRFYREFDPFYFWTVAECVHSAKHASINMVDKGTSELVNDHSLMQRIERSRESYSNYSSYLVRALRYFCSETLMLLLFSEVGNNPFARVASVMRGDKLLSPVRAISKGEVPSGYAVRIGGRPLTFEEWVTFRAFGSPDYLANDHDASLFELVKDEAALVSERGAINAFKHGKAVSFGDGLAMSVADDEGEYQALNEVVEGLNWVDWFEDQKKNLFSISFGTEALGAEQDKKRIFATGLLMDAIVQARRAEIDGEKSVTIQLPAEVPQGSTVKRQKFKISLGSKDKQ